MREHKSKQTKRDHGLVFFVAHDDRLRLTIETIMPIRFSFFVLQAAKKSKRIVNGTVAMVM
jgi:hypothetical protein